MKTLILALSLLSFLSCTTKKKLDQTSETDRVQGTSADTVSQATKRKLPGGPAPQKGLSDSATTWVYEKKIDKEGNTVHKASIHSPNLLEFGFPYAGGSTATLSIRHKNGTSYLYLEVSKGQFNRSFQGGTARIRFDDKPARDYSFSAAENGRANIIFFDSVQPLVDQLKLARKAVVAVEFYAQGKRQIEFRTGSLRWNH
ncbi:hypothetical protein [Spirosoma pollinicola]|uniref:Uncharacterized protein n=1 Tax=Spirosoma pollinicola TaxID=2057025 RepID=A0A2K8Z7L0_9BACT|nr:hypothetical protein [Spirosoma pollinicola]AUD05840.1 hypothetical protein CWM47_30735 [Spirosoma pollinicola]